MSVRCLRTVAVRDGCSAGPSEIDLWVCVPPPADLRAWLHRPLHHRYKMSGAPQAKNCAFVLRALESHFYYRFSLLQHKYVRTSRNIPSRDSVLTPNS